LLACLLAEILSTQLHSYIISQGISTQDYSKPAASVQNSVLTLSLSLSLFKLFSSTKYKTKTSSSLQKQMPVNIPFLLQIHGHKSSIYNLTQIKTSYRQKEQTPIPPVLPNFKSISHKSSI
jgi:hypothetical protein